MSTKAVAALVQKAVRTIYTYTVPKKLGTSTNTIGMVELTADDELAATKRARGDATQLAFELTKQSLVQVNGIDVGLGDGSVDAAFNKMSPKVRNLVMHAYAQLNAPGDGDAESFLASQEANAG